VKAVSAILVFAVAILLGLLAHAVGPKDLNLPPSKLQKVILYPMRGCARLLLLLLGIYWVKTKGKPAKGTEAPIIVSNHIHLWEVAYLFYVFGPSAVSRKENGAIPGIGQLLKVTRGLMVDRMSPTSRADTLEAIKARGLIASKDERWPQVLIFPEGTTSNGKVVCSFKVGAFAPGLPVQPVAVKFPFRFFDPCWSIDGPGMVGAMLRMFSQFYNRMEVTFLPVYHPSEAEKANPRLFAKNVRDLIAKELGLPGSHHSSEDALLQVQALKHRIPLEHFNTDMSTMHELLNLDFEGARDLLGRFGTAHRMGHVDFQSFCKFLKLPPTEEVEDLFTVFDVEQTGTIDLKRLVLGLSTLNAKGTNAHETIHRAWRVFDCKNVGFLTQEDLVAVMLTVFPAMLKDDVRSLFTAADSNKDGKLTWEEFDTFWRKHPEYVAIAQVQMAKRTAAAAAASSDSSSTDFPASSSESTEKIKTD
jgi:lysophosphatidylcholine acyltransferase/lyso-PAF acetyltransferase